MTAPRILFIGHYPLDILDRAPKVRISHMKEALARVASVTMVSDTRSARRRQLSALVDNLKHGQYDAVYLESASSTATPSDIHFLSLARRYHVPVGIFVRDAYQFFPDLYPQKGLKHRILAVLYDLTIAQYKRLATSIFVPSVGLAEAIGIRDAVLLPPGAEWKASSSRERTHRIIYVGAAGPHDGVERLVQVMDRVIAVIPDAELVLVMRKGEATRFSVPLRGGISVVEAAGDALRALYATAQVAVIARPDTRYNRLAIPVKLFEYLSYGCPVVVTGPSEVANLVRVHRLGWVADDTEESLANCLIAALLYAGPPFPLKEFVEENSWDARAQTVLESLL